MSTPAPSVTGSALWLDIAESRRKNFPTFTDAQYAHLLSRVAERFPGMEVLVCLPANGKTVLRFTWDAESLLAHKILEPGDIPQGKRRLQWRMDLTVRRVRGGRLEVAAAVRSENDHAAPCSLYVGLHHPLAIFLPSAVQAIQGHGRLRPPWLRLVVDNTRVQP